LDDASTTPLFLGTTGAANDKKWPSPISANSAVGGAFSGQYNTAYGAGILLAPKVVDT